MAIKHKVIRFDCNQCDYQGTDEDKLGIHKKKAHEAKVHACDKCHFNSSILGEMNEYVDTMHKVIGYDCDKIQLYLTHSFNLFVVCLLASLLNTGCSDWKKWFLVGKMEVLRDKMFN